MLYFLCYSHTLLNYYLNCEQVLLQKNHIYTSEVVIRGALRAEKPELLTVFFS
ncbi:hypothetical protein KFK09_014719 [Dendrobium nobile]|uniref:Uncharacterized protein n=1 Tax=Dendrobium nobile TaxID=94219 RepID=A0A8T3B8R1_DENNO|nr:hypothetical protein KFK09_014719 [Dendrobium nobile]